MLTTSSTIIVLLNVCSSWMETNVGNIINTKVSYKPEIILKVHLLKMEPLKKCYNYLYQSNEVILGRWHHNITFILERDF
jgi:hypothetical protein